MGNDRFGVVWLVRVHGLWLVLGFLGGKIRYQTGQDGETERKVRLASPDSKQAISSKPPNPNHPTAQAINSDSKPTLNQPSPNPQIIPKIIPKTSPNHPPNPQIIPSQPPGPVCLRFNSLTFAPPKAPPSQLITGRAVRSSTKMARLGSRESSRSCSKT